MDKYAYLVEALKAGCYRKTDWLISLFCLFTEDTEVKDYAYRLKKDMTGYSYIAPDMSIVKIEGSSLNEPLFLISDAITVTPEICPIASGSIESNVSTLISNYILLVYSFGTKIGYVNERFDPYKVLEPVKANLKSKLKEGETPDPQAFYTDELQRFGEAIYFMSCLTQVCTIAGTEKTMTAPDGIQEYKKQLLKEYQEQGKSLTDPTVIADMDKKLIAFDEKYREGDEGNDFLLGDKKAIQIVRKKKFLQLGGEQGVGSNASQMKYLGHSLDEGHTLESFPDVNNTMRMGSYARGAETMLGGVEVKKMFRLAGSTNVISKDCGSTLGMPRPINDKNKADYVGYHLVNDKGVTVPIESEDQLTPFVGQYARFRSPAYCKAGKTDKCSICIGPILSATPHALPAAVSNYGSTFMGLSMSQNHGKVLAVQELDLEDLFI